MEVESDALKPELHGTLRTLELMVNLAKGAVKVPLFFIKISFKLKLYYYSTQIN
jgi:hypothetical protein